LGRLKVFDGMPFPYDHKKRMVVPEALKIVRLRDNRKFSVLGDIAKLVGWTKKDVIERLENKRKQKADQYYQNRKKRTDARRIATGNKDLSALNQELANYGF
jgi:large subunit ribosomal protein L13Ae